METIDPAIYAMGEELCALVQLEINAQPDLKDILVTAVYYDVSVDHIVNSLPYTFWIMAHNRNMRHLELTGENVSLTNRVRAADLVIGVLPNEVNVVKNRNGDRPTLALAMADPLYFEKFRRMLVQILA